MGRGLGRAALGKPSQRELRECHLAIEALAAGPPAPFASSSASNPRPQPRPQCLTLFPGLGIICGTLVRLSSSRRPRDGQTLQWVGVPDVGGGRPFVTTRSLPRRQHTPPRFHLSPLVFPP